MAKTYLLIDLLNSFTTKELQSFLAFADCKYHNHDEHAYKLLEFLIGEVIHKNNFNEDLQFKAFTKIESNKTQKLLQKQLSSSQKSILLTKMSVLLKLAKFFLINETLYANPNKGNNLLLQQILNRNQIALFNRTLSKYKASIDGITAKSFDNYEEKMSIELNQLSYLNKQGLLVKEDNLEELNKFLDIYFILNKISIHNLSISLSGFSEKTSFDFSILKELEFLLSKPAYSNHPLISAYVCMSNLWNKEDHPSYLKLIDLLETRFKNIPKQDLKNLYVTTLSFCSKKIKEGKLEYYKKMFELYQKMDLNNLINEDNFIQAGSLKNIVTIGCKMEEYVWALNMVEKYKNDLQKEYQLSAYHFNVGAIAYYKKQYDKALNHFIKVEKVNLAYDIDCRIMILKCHYELDEEYDERAMRRFVMAERYIQSNKELTSKNKKAYKNFIRFLLNTYRIKHKATRMTLESIINKIDKAEFISDKKWLLEKIEALKKNKRRTLS